MQIVQENENKLKTELGKWASDYSNLTKTLEFKTLIEPLYLEFDKHPTVGKPGDILSFMPGLASSLIIPPSNFDLQNFKDSSDAHIVKPVIDMMQQKYKYARPPLNELIEKYLDLRLMETIHRIDQAEYNRKAGKMVDEIFNLTEKRYMESTDMKDEN